MFGLFQTDIPIGRRLWVLILVIVIAGSSTNIINFYSQDPIVFAINILIYFGYVYILSFGIAIVPGMIGQIIEREIDYRRIKEKNYQSAVMSHSTEIWFEILVNLSFVVATYISVSSFGNPEIIEIGALGLSLLVLLEIFDINLLYKETPEILLLTNKVKGRLMAKIISENDKKFILKSDFLTEMRQLILNKWEMIDITKSKEQSEALFLRYVRTSRLDIMKSRINKTKSKGKTKNS